MLDTTVKLTGDEAEALLEQVRNRIDDNEFWEEHADDEGADSGVDYNAELAFWRAIEVKLMQQ